MRQEMKKNKQTWFYTGVAFYFGGKIQNPVEMVMDLLEYDILFKRSL